MKPVALTVLLLTTTAYAENNAPFNVNLPSPAPDSYLHQAPTVEELLAQEKMKPQLKEVILKGRDIFMNTQQLRGKYVFNDMNCRSCHLGEGGMNFSGPVWPAVTTLPDYRGKNKHVNDVQERIAGCFAYSMNGIPPEYGSDTMLSLVAYHQWLAKNAPIYDDRPIAGRGFRDIGDPPQEPDYQRGAQVFSEHCAVCHGSDGQGQKVDGQYAFPPLWGDHSYNWGAGMARVFTLATFIKWNMPLGQPGKLSDQEAWDVAEFVNSQERPQDPRFTGDAKETREQFLNFHKHSRYGTERDGKILGQHENTGDKPLLKPWNLRPRMYEDGSAALLPPTN